MTSLKNSIGAIALSAILPIAAPAATSLLTDNFDTSGAPPLSGRVYENTIDQGWQSTPGWSGNENVNSNWEITSTAGGRMENPTASGADHYIAGESPVWQWFSNSASGSSSDTNIKIDFDYGVGTGDSLTMHFWAVQSGGVAGTNSFITNNQGWSNGNSSQNQVSSSVGYTPYNLLDGSNAPTTSSLSGALTGTGSYSGTVDLGSLGIAGIDTVGDIDGFFIAFAGIEVGGGTTWVDTLAVTAVPEPSATALLGLCGLAFILRRRK